MRVTRTENPDSSPRASESPTDNTRRTPTPTVDTAAQALTRAQFPPSFLGKRRQSTASLETASDAPSSQRFRASGTTPEAISGGLGAPVAQAAGASRHAVGTPELVGPVMMTNVRHYADGTRMGEIDPHDEDTRNELISFLFEIDGDDRAALASRFEHDYPPDAFDPRIYDGMVVAVKDEVIAGFMDYSETELHAPGQVAQINILVAKEHRGTDVARNLAKQVDEALLARGFRYKLSRVWESNTAQLERKHRRGWRPDPALTVAGDTKAFWIALNPTFADIPPPRRSPAR